MLIFYVIYCIALHFNSALEKWAHSLNLPIKLPSKEEQSALVTYKNLPETSYTQEQQAVTSLSQDPNAQVPTPQTQTTDQGYNGYNAYDQNASWDPNAAWGENTAAAPVAPQPTTAPASSTNSWDTYNSTGNTTGWDPVNSWDGAEGQKNYGYNTNGDNMEQSNETKSNSQVVAMPQQQKGSEFYKSRDNKATEIQNPLDKPIDGGLPAQISWAIVYPIHYMCRLTMPDCRTEKYKNWYPFTFLISMIWISFYSYFMVNIF